MFRAVQAAVYRILVRRWRLAVINSRRCRVIAITNAILYFRVIVYDDVFNIRTNVTRLVNVSEHRPVKQRAK